MTAPDLEISPDVEAVEALVGYGADLSSAVTAPVTVSLAPGSKLAIVGANGTGKSTVLKAISGQLGILAGQLHVFGANIDERSADFRRDVAVVLDDDAYLPVLTVLEHLLLTARAHGAASPGGLVTEVIEDFGLTARSNAVPTALSGGQRRRLLLAAAFVRPRRLLVLDEPEQRLDAGMRDTLGERLGREESSLVIATHDPHLVRAFATHALILTDDTSELAAPEEGAAAIEALR